MIVQEMENKREEVLRRFFESNLSSGNSLGSDRSLLASSALKRTDT